MDIPTKNTKRPLFNSIYFAQRLCANIYKINTINIKSQEPTPEVTRVT